jgi:phosphotransacetylase
MGIGIPVLISRRGDPGKIQDLGLECNPEIVNPLDFNRLEDYAKMYYQLRNRKV